MSDVLNILWTSGDPITAEKMLLMYAHAAQRNGWWTQVRIIVWGASAQLIAESEVIRARLQEAIADGVQVSACKACADQLGVTGLLEGMGVEVKFWGQPLTELVKRGDKLITV